MGESYKNPIKQVFSRSDRATGQTIADLPLKPLFAGDLGRDWRGQHGRPSQAPCREIVALEIVGAGSGVATRAPGTVERCLNAANSSARSDVPSIGMKPRAAGLPEV